LAGDCFSRERKTPGLGKKGREKKKGPATVEKNRKGGMGEKKASLPGLGKKSRSPPRNGEGGEREKILTYFRREKGEGEKRSREKEGSFVSKEGLALARGKPVEVA